MNICLLGENLIISEKNQRYLYMQTDVTTILYQLLVLINLLTPVSKSNVYKIIPSVYLNFKFYWLQRENVKFHYIISLH